MVAISLPILSTVAPLYNFCNDPFGRLCVGLFAAYNVHKTGQVIAITST